jgi:hypothetical protein
MSLNPMLKLGRSDGNYYQSADLGRIASKTFIFAFANEIATLQIVLSPIKIYNRNYEFSI